MLLFYTSFLLFCHIVICCNGFSSRQAYVGSSRQITIEKRKDKKNSSRTGQSLSRSSSVTMKIKVGILGLPNVGKSTLFNAIAQKSIAEAANYPFCTIDPNIAPVAVPDPYLQQLGTFAKSAKTVPATIQWVDVAGLAKGAHRGEGLGNRFLAALRECDAICHLVRIFKDTDVVHVSGKVDPAVDAEVINLELLLADEAHVEKRLAVSTCKGIERLTLEKVLAGLSGGVPARALDPKLSSTEIFSIKSMGLLSLKPMLYAFNVDEIDACFSSAIQDAKAKCREVFRSIDYCDVDNDRWAMVSARMDSEVARLGAEERKKYLLSLGVDNNDDDDDNSRMWDYDLNTSSGSTVANGATAGAGAAGVACCVLPSLVLEVLGLGVAYTGPGVPKEKSQTTKAHLFTLGSLTAEALAGRLHGDIQKGFIKAEVVSAPDLRQHDSYADAKASGAIRTEGRDYDIQPHDVVLIKYK